jgi:hypothetical protein
MYKEQVHKPQENKETSPPPAVFLISGCGLLTLDPASIQSTHSSSSYLLLTEILEWIFG